VSGATIVAYDGSNSPTSAAAVELMPGVVDLGLSRGAGLTAGSGATFNSSGWTDETDDYLQWGWSLASPVDLTDLDLRYDRSTSGPSTVNIQLAVNGGTFQSVFTDASVLDTGEDALNIDLSGFTGVTSATFRLFGSGASSGTGTFDIEPMSGVSPDRGIVVNGVAAVPEPAGWTLAALGALTMLLQRRIR
jgi:hypothetical protein